MSSRQTSKASASERSGTSSSATGSAEEAVSSAVSPRLSPPRSKRSRPNVESAVTSRRSRWRPIRSLLIDPESSSDEENSRMSEASSSNMNSTESEGSSLSSSNQSTGTESSMWTTIDEEVVTPNTAASTTATSEAAVSDAASTSARSGTSRGHCYVCNRRSFIDRATIRCVDCNSEFVEFLNNEPSSSTSTSSGNDLDPSFRSAFSFMSSYLDVLSRHSRPLHEADSPPIRVFAQ